MDIIQVAQRSKISSGNKIVTREISLYSLTFPNYAGTEEDLTQKLKVDPCNANMWSSKPEKSENITYIQQLTVSHV